MIFEIDSNLKLYYCYYQQCVLFKPLNDIIIKELTKKNPAAVALGKLSGKVRSAKKAAASRENGKKGGRPPKISTALTK